jgi:hypothetical protein
MSAKNKRSAAGSPAPQIRHVRSRHHRRTGSGSSSQGFDPSLEGIPEAGFLQHCSGDSVAIDYMYDADNCSITSASVHDGSSIHDGSSVLGDEGDEEVLKYFGGARNEFLWNSNCTEWKICNEENTDAEALIAEIRKDPRRSIIATMGLKSIKKDLLINQTNEARWSGNAATYAAKVSEYVLKEEGLKGAVDDAYNNLRKANDDHHHLQLKMSTLQDSRRNFEEHGKRYERRAGISSVVIKVMQEGRGFSQVFGGRVSWPGLVVDGTQLPYGAPHSWHRGGC